VHLSVIHCQNSAARNLLAVLNTLPSNAAIDDRNDLLQVIFIVVLLRAAVCVCICVCVGACVHACVCMLMCLAANLSSVDSNFQLIAPLTQLPNLPTAQAEGTSLIEELFLYHETTVTIPLQLVVITYLCIL